MSLRITGRQRELLYQHVADRLTGIDAVWRVVEAKDWEEAQRYGREYADYLLLLVNGLGWEDRCSEPVTLTAPSDALERVLKTIKMDVSVEDREERELRLQVAAAQLERQDSLDTCDELMAELQRLSFGNF